LIKLAGVPEIGKPLTAVGQSLICAIAIPNLKIVPFSSTALSNKCQK